MIRTLALACLIAVFSGCGGGSVQNSPSTGEENSEGTGEGNSEGTGEENSGGTGEGNSGGERLNWWFERRKAISLARGFQLSMSPAQVENKLVDEYKYKSNAREDTYTATYFTDGESQYILPDGKYHYHNYYYHLETIERMRKYSIGRDYYPPYSGSEYQPVMEHREISLYQVKHRQPILYGNRFIHDDYRFFGGWMSHSGFGVMRLDEHADPFSGFDPATQSNLWAGAGFYGAAAKACCEQGTLRSPVGPVDWTGAAVSGKGTWSGVMVGVDWSSPSTRGNPLQGDAEIVVDLTAGATSYRIMHRKNRATFTNIYDLETGDRLEDVTYPDLLVLHTDQGGWIFQSVFQPSGYPEGSTTWFKGRFAGPNHEEVVGAFSIKEVMIGAFGTRKQ